VKDLTHEWDKMVQNSAKTESWVQKIFCTLPPNFIKGLNESWHKFCSFFVNESEENEAKG
jgi:hypothetical protein